MTTEVMSEKITTEVIGGGGEEGEAELFILLAVTGVASPSVILEGVNGAGWGEEGEELGVLSLSIVGQVVVVGGCGDGGRTGCFNSHGVIEKCDFVRSLDRHVRVKEEHEIDCATGAGWNKK